MILFCFYDWVYFISSMSSCLHVFMFRLLTWLDGFVSLVFIWSCLFINLFVSFYMIFREIIQQHCLSLCFPILSTTVVNFFIYRMLLDWSLSCNCIHSHEGMLRFIMIEGICTNHLLLWLLLRTFCIEVGISTNHSSPAVGWIGSTFDEEWR